MVSGNVSSIGWISAGSNIPRANLHCVCMSILMTIWNVCMQAYWCLSHLKPNSLETARLRSESFISPLLYAS